MKKNDSDKPSFLDHHPEAKGLLLLGFSLIMFLSLYSYNPQVAYDNWLGLLGFVIAFGLTFTFGLGSYLLIFYLGWLGIKFLSRGRLDHVKAKTFYFTLFLFSACILLNVIAETQAPFPSSLKQKVPIETVLLQLPYPQMHVRHNLGGVPFYYLYRDLPVLSLQHLLSNVGIFITFSITAFVSTLLFTETKIALLGKFVKKYLLSFLQMYQSRKERKKSLLYSSLQQDQKQIKIPENTPFPRPIFPPQKRPFVKKEVLAKDFSETKRQIALKAQRVANGDFADYQIPMATLLHDPQKIDSPTLKKDVRRLAELLEETLLSFGIEAKVGEIHCGPTITSFEVHPAVGVKVQKIKTLENDIALNLQAKSIRIIAPIPGKAAVGVEIPSLISQEVSFKELLLMYQQQKKKFHVPILLGKTVSGETVMSDLTRMPHCIIAGATGSGKSVCINTIVMSILMNARPDEIKLLMIDPKKVELTGYTNLPHMIAPVITEAHGAYAALNWLVKEMQFRYEILKQLGLRNISAFNTRKKDASFEESLSIPIPEQMPLFVAIIDEFADLMMASSSDLETPIARIAQMARAVGIHLILATQRPSREVITGLIKANFPTRIAFKVASRINSQIILDETGAENLLGNGDMLFLPPGSSQLIRAQGTFISDEEIHRVITCICDQAPPKYLIPSFDSMPREQLQLLDGKTEETKDSLYKEAFSIVVETRNASTTYLQRKLKIGYARAASLMDELESNGVIGPQEGAKPRPILVSSNKLKTMDTKD